MPEPEPQPQPQPKPKPKPEPEPKPKFKPNLKAEPKPNPEPNPNQVDLAKEAFHFSLVGIQGNDIVVGNSKLALALFWQQVSYNASAATALSHIGLQPPPLGLQPHIT